MATVTGALFLPGSTDQLGGSGTSDRGAPSGSPGGFQSAALLDAAASLPLVQPAGYSGASDTVSAAGGDTVSGADNASIAGAAGDTIIGASGDTIAGAADDSITGGDNSSITGATGDTIVGGAQDTITGGSGDTIVGGANDSITGGDNNVISGGTGDTIVGGSNDTIVGGVGDSITGGINNLIAMGSSDTVIGGVGDTIVGGVQPGFDSIMSYSGHETVEGTPADETVSGFDTVTGPGHDAIAFAGEDKSAIQKVVATQQVNDGSVTLHLPDGSAMTLVGVTHIDSSFFH